MTITRSGLLHCVLLTVALAGCEGRDKSTADSAAPPAAGFTVGGTLTGLASGESVVLKVNGVDPQTVSAGGKFMFSSGIGANGSYSVTVATAPVGQTCTVTGGEGTVTATSVANIVVTCSDETFSLGGTISGLGARSGLILKNGTDSRSVAANATSFVMPTPVSFDSTYAVTVQSAPSGLTCTTSRGAGTMPAGNVSNVAVTCIVQTHTVGGSVSGLTTAGLVLANGSDTFAVAANATSFTMPTGVATGSNYNVTVKVHPPLESCSVTNGAGPVAGANITNVAVACAPGAGETVLYSFATSVDAAYPLRQSLLLASDGNFYGMTYYDGVHGYGAVFKITPAGAETVLYSFAGGADGEEPYGSLVQGTDGNFYGLTYSGGTHGDGTVFKITPAGAETVLYSFGSGADGEEPYGSLVQGTDGNFYGMTESGGTQSEGTVFKITPAGVETVLWSFGSGIDGIEPYGALVQGSDGSFYGMTYEGGTHNDGTVFKITPAGAETVLYSFAGGADGDEPYGSLVQGTDGNFYGMTYEGGPTNDGTVFKITPAGAETVLYAFGSGADGNEPYGSLVQGTDGNFYGMTYEGGANNEGTIFQVTPSGTETVLWSLGAGSDGNEPYGSLTFGPDGTLYGLTYEGGANGGGAVIQFN